MVSKLFLPAVCLVASTSSFSIPPSFASSLSLTLVVIVGRRIYNDYDFVFSLNIIQHEKNLNTDPPLSLTKVISNFYRRSLVRLEKSSSLVTLCRIFDTSATHTVKAEHSVSIFSSRHSASLFFLLAQYNAWLFSKYFLFTLWNMSFPWLLPIICVLENSYPRLNRCFILKDYKPGTTSIQFSINLAIEVVSVDKDTSCGFMGDVFCYCTSARLEGIRTIGFNPFVLLSVRFVLTAVYLDLRYYQL